jgi:hypothetical protein
MTLRETLAARGFKVTHGKPWAVVEATCDHCGERQTWLMPTREPIRCVKCRRVLK